MGLVSEEHLGVAVVDDDAVFRDLTCALLAAKTPFCLFPAASGDELIQLLSEQRIDCILLDYNLGNETGFAIKTKLDERFDERPPIIMLTGDGRESTAIKAFRMGVNDYLPKLSLQPKALVDTIARVVSDERTRHTVRAEHRRLVEAAAIDLITGLPGKAHLEERLAQLAGLPASGHGSYAIVLIELVEYKVIIERFGLKVSDLAVRAFGKQLKLNTRSNDICGRYEKGMFLIIADVKGDPVLLDLICGRLRQNLAMNVDADVAKLGLTPCVVGMICADGPEDRLTGSSLLEGPLSLLDQTKAGAASPAKLPQDEAAVREVTRDAQCAVAAPVEPALRPAADRLRTTDRRREFRQRVFKRGIIHVPNTHATFDCTVRNLSNNGAGLRIKTPFAVPVTFDLEIVGSGERRPVQVRWQASVDLGVEYVPDRAHIA